MKLFCIVLNVEEVLEEILSLFLELGVPGATLIDSVGMGHIIAHDIPIFAGLRNMLSGHKPYNRLILTVLSDELCDQVISEMKAIVQSNENKNLGIMFTLPVDSFYNLSQVLKP